MSQPDIFSLNQWYVIEAINDLKPVEDRKTRLLGRDIIGSRNAVGEVSVTLLDDQGNRERELQVLERYGYVWTSLSEDPKPLFEMAEFEEEGRRLIICGLISVHTSPARIVENFLDLAHFPFVHRDVLGAEREPALRFGKVRGLCVEERKLGRFNGIAKGNKRELVTSMNASENRLSILEVEEAHQLAPCNQRIEVRFCAIVRRDPGGHDEAGTTLFLESA